VVLGKSVFLVNHSVYPADSELLTGTHAERIYRFLYRHLDYVAVREPSSRRLLQELGVTSQQSLDCSVLELQSLDMVERRRRIVAGTSSVSIPDTSAYLDFFSALRADDWECRFIYGAPVRTAPDDLSFARIKVPGFRNLEC
jgi:hypothetical protein